MGREIGNRRRHERRCVSETQKNSERQICRPAGASGTGDPNARLERVATAYDFTPLASGHDSRSAAPSSAASSLATMLSSGRARLHSSGSVLAVRPRGNVNASVG